MFYLTILIHTKSSCEASGTWKTIFKFKKNYPEITKCMYVREQVSFCYCKDWVLNLQAVWRFSVSHIRVPPWLADWEEFLPLLSTSPLHQNTGPPHSVHSPRQPHLPHTTLLSLLHSPSSPTDQKENYMCTFFHRHRKAFLNQ